jgi:hypothetical protein
MAHDPYALSDEDRLPWLEPVDEIGEERAGVSFGWVAPLLGLLLLAAIVVGVVWWWQNREVTPSGSGALIQAPKEPYKVRPTEEGGTTFQGQGDVVYKTSQGQQVEGSLDLSALPETPVTRTPPKPQAEPKPARSATAEVDDGDAKPAAKAPPAAVEPEGPAGATIQLGAFPTDASAKKSWETKSKRFAYLADMGHMVLKAEVNGRTYYRLRVTAASAQQAKDICARLRVAGESCLVVN